MQKEEEEEKKRTNHAYHACIFLVSISTCSLTCRLCLRLLALGLVVYISSFSAAGLPYLRSSIVFSIMFDLA